MEHQETEYSIPKKWREMENLHIVFWLIKDICWCMVWRPLGLLMVAPTLIISVVIAWRTRALESERYHNYAVTAWITANAYWMISEFFEFDAKPLAFGFTWRYLALLPFGLGLLSLAYYYLLRRPKLKTAEQRA